MIFFTWYSLWVILATSSLSLTLPFLALGTRSAYLNRTMLRWGNLLSLAVLFLYTFSVSQLDWKQAALLGLRVLAFGLLFTHFIAGVNEIRLSRLPFWIAIVKHLGVRYLRIIKERQEEIFYAFKVRLAVPEMALKSRIKIFIAASINTAIEFIGLVKQISMITNSRGELTHPKGWIASKRVDSRYFLGDMVFLFLLLFSIWFGSEYITPEPIKDSIIHTKERVNKMLQPYTQNIKE
jgi:hypothetical protein